MLAKRALPVTAALSLSCAAIAQQPAEAKSPNLPGARYYSEQPQQEGALRAAAIRRAWLASGHQAESPPLTAPAITGGKIAGKTFDVAAPPAAPKVTLNFQTGSSGISSISLYFHTVAANGQQLYLSHNVTYKSPAVTQGTWTLQDVGDSVGYGSFNFYAAPGKWILDNAYIYDQAGNYTGYYNEADLAAIFGCPGATDCITVKVTNNGTPDVKPPAITAGKILTPKVSLASSPATFAATLTVSDNISGVHSSYVQVCPPSGSGGSCVSFSNYTAAPLLSGKNTNYDWVCNGTGKCSTTPTGVWTIYDFGACDVARNCITDYDATDIANLFGTTTFKVTP